MPPSSPSRQTAHDDSALLGCSSDTLSCRGSNGPWSLLPSSPTARTLFPTIQVAEDSLDSPPSPSEERGRLSVDLEDEDTFRSFEGTVTASISTGRYSHPGSMLVSGVEDMDAWAWGAIGDEAFFGMDYASGDPEGDYGESRRSGPDNSALDKTPASPTEPESDSARGIHRSSLRWGVAHMLDARLASYMVPGAASPQVKPKHGASRAIGFYPTRTASI